MKSCQPIGGSSYSPECVEGEFCELRHDGVLESPYSASCIDRSRRAARMPSKGLRPCPLRWWAPATNRRRDQPMWCLKRHSKTTISRRRSSSSSSSFSLPGAGGTPARSGGGGGPFGDLAPPEDHLGYQGGIVVGRHVAAAGQL